MKAFMAIGFIAGTVVGSIATYVVTSNSNSSATAVARAPACTSNAIAKAIAETPALCPAAKPLPFTASFEQPSDEEASLAFRNRPNSVPNSQAVLKVGSCKEGGLASHITCGAEIDWKGDGKKSTQRTLGFTKSTDSWIAVLY